MTVRELLSRMDARELSEWLAYYQLEAEEHGHAPSGKKQTEKQMKEALMGFSPKRK